MTRRSDSPNTVEDRGALSLTRGQSRLVSALGWLITLAMVGLAGRVVQLQMSPDDRVGALVDSQMSTRDLPGRRGAIYDRRGRLMAVTRVEYRLFVDPSLAPDLDLFIDQVAFRLGYSPAMIRQKIETSRSPRYVVIDDRARPERVAALEADPISGVVAEPLYVRSYPLGALAGQLIGFVSLDNRGLEGLEFALNDELTAESGSLTSLRDAARRPLFVRTGAFAAPQDGQHLRLAIDATLQSLCERRLAETVARFGAESGQCILMDPNTGEVLAMAHAPNFDPSNFRQSNPEDWRNRCVTDVFEPGAIFKPFIWAGLTQAGYGEPLEILDTENGAWVSPFGRRLHDAYPYDELTWEGVLVKSSNIGMAKIAMRASHSELERMIRRFGFGLPTGVGLPGEVSGLVTSSANWSDYTQTSVPMGQEIAVTPLQIVRAFSAIANGGTLVTPTLIAVDPHDPPAGLVQRVVLQPEVAELARLVMRRVVSPEGSGRRGAEIAPHYSIFGKTGTAQLPSPDGGYYDDRYFSSFVAGAPLERPRLVIGYFIKDPDKTLGIGHGGGAVAAPDACLLLQEALAYLGVAPDEKAFSDSPDGFLFAGGESVFEFPNVLNAIRSAAMASTAQNHSLARDAVSPAPNMSQGPSESALLMAVESEPTAESR